MGHVATVDDSILESGNHETKLSKSIVFWGGTAKRDADATSDGERKPKKPRTGKTKKEQPGKPPAKPDKPQPQPGSVITTSVLTTCTCACM